MHRLLCFAVICLVFALPVQAQSTFTVNSTGDQSDATSTDGSCDVNPSQGGPQCTLRAAIQQANATTATDVIAFEIPSSATPSSPHVILVDTPLPDITESVEIDGTTDSDHSDRPVIEIDGTNAGSGADGLTVAFEMGGGGGLVVKDLALVNFDDTGILIQDDVNGNTVTGCHIGVRADGVTQAANDRGIFVGADADQTVIGGSSVAAENVISGNLSEALAVTAAVRIVGNRVGIDINGDPLPNGGSTFDVAIAINGDDVLVQGNTIAHNAGIGVQVNDTTPPDVRNTIRGNNMFSNGGIGIDLEGGTEDSAGRTANDAGDGDDGQNRFQNYPEIQSAGYDSGADEVTLTYFVDSDPSLTGDGASTYDLTIDFYRADADDEESNGIIGTDTYTSTDYSGCGTPPCPKTITLTPLASITESDDVIATATDANGNTSEFSTPARQLPVELVAFEGAHVDAGIQLTWQTVSETNNAGFRVERKRSGGQAREEIWTELGTVDGAGTTSAPQAYRFVDREVPFTAETVTYRLRQVDVDGTTTFSPPIIVEAGVPEQVTLFAPFPNPARSSATLRWAVPTAMDVEIGVYNVIGQRMLTLAQGRQAAGRVERRLDTSRLPSGLYFVRLRADGQISTQQVTVVR